LGLQKTIITTSMTNILIRKATINDLHNLQTISAQTFTETFADVNTEEDMIKYLEDNFNARQLSSELENPDSAFYLAIMDHTVVGYLKLNFGQAQTDVKDPHAMEIERIYVLKAFHNKKIGKRLFGEALTFANEKQDRKSVV